MSLLARVLLQLVLLQCLMLSSVSSRSEVGTISFAIITDTVAKCDIGLTNAGIYAVLEYRNLQEDPITWEHVGVVSIPAPNSSQCQHNFSMDFTYQHNSSSSSAEESQDALVQFRLLQWEHGGGFCNCWGIVSDSVRVRFGNETHSILGLTTGDMEACATSTSSWQPDESVNARCNQIATVGYFCIGSASVPRGLLFPVLNFRTGSQEPCPKGRNIIIEPAAQPLQLNNCSNASSKIVVKFLLEFLNRGECDRPFGADKGVELAVGNWKRDGYWIPISYYYISRRRRMEIEIGPSDNNFTSVIIRGHEIYTTNITGSISVALEICDPMLLGHSHVQFRWLETVRHNKRMPPVDVWLLDNVYIEYVNGNTTRALLQETFDSLELNDTLWNQDVRNGNLTGSVTCTPREGNFLFFSDNEDMLVGSGRITIASRLVTTAPLELRDTDGEVMESPASPSQTSLGPALPINDGGTERMVTTTAPPDNPNVALQQSSRKVLMLIKSDPMLRRILEELPEDAIVSLADITLRSRSPPQNPLVPVFLLSHILNRTSGDHPLSQEFIQEFLEVGSHLLDTNLSAPELLFLEEEEVAIVGSTILGSVERFALDTSETGNKTVGNIILNTRVEATERDEDVPVFKPRSDISLQVPRELLVTLGNRSLARSNRQVRMVSLLFSNGKELFPNVTLHGIKTELVSDIISTTLQCDGGELCPTAVEDGVDLDDPIIITIAHTPEVQERLEADNDSNTFCVFWDFLAEEDILSIGEWSDRDCTRNDTLSNTSVTVCECTHLTHFAILLSAAPLSLSDPVTLSLEIIGYVGVSISLVAMALTVFTFIAFRSLRNMRNYIHINLCISLGIAQLTFVAGVGSTGDPVPIHCQVVAVLLHYFFLVSFMWMLMEGVILYIALVRVFVERKKLYLFAFTVTSYGLPLLYLGLLTLPLGFALPTQPNYGYDTACFLNPDTHFIWALIAPVIVIIVINVGFFIMAASIMWRHQKKQTDNTYQQRMMNWLRSALSLMVIMGLTWIFGVLIVEVEELVPLAYIYTILVAFQGVFIFLIFVVFSKQVREAYAKWWKVKVNESDILSKLMRDTPSTFLKSSTSLKKTSSHHQPPLIPRPIPPQHPPVALSPEPTTCCNLPTIPINEAPPAEKDATPHSNRSKKHWQHLRKNVQEGTTFRVVYSAKYFEPNGQENDTYTLINDEALKDKN